MGAGKAGDFGKTKGSRLDALSDLLAAASLIPGLDTFTNLASIPVDLVRGDFLSAGLSAFGELHDLIHGQNWGYQEILENAKGWFNK